MTPSAQEYLKQIYLFTSEKGTIIQTKKLAELVKVSLASASDIMKRLAKKKMLIYNRTMNADCQNLVKKKPCR
jgi:Mn-dependent DtxR family transcriptional regulator